MTIKELKDRHSGNGKLEWIGVRPQKKGDLISVESVFIDQDSGLEGDHYAKKKGERLVTLIQMEHLSVVSHFLNKPVEPGMVRRNLVVSGINLNALHNVQFSIGRDVVLEGTGYCHPCSRMEENLGKGGYNAMRGHGGITSKVIRGGDIKKGDEIVFYKTISD